MLSIWRYRTVSRNVEQRVRDSVAREWLKGYRFFEPDLFEDEKFASLMTPEGRRLLDQKVLGFFNGVRLAMLGALYGFKMKPRSWSPGMAEALRRLYGVEPLSNMQAIFDFQAWRAHALVEFNDVGSPTTDVPATTPLGRDMLVFYQGASMAGFYEGAWILRVLSRADKAYLLATLPSMDEALVIGGFKGFAGYRLGRDGKLHEARPKDGARERPMYDGYIVQRFEDPGLKRFDERVEEAIRRIARQDVAKQAMAIWRAVKSVVHAFAPAYMHVYGVDRGRVPEAVARAVVDLALLYRELVRAKTKPFTGTQRMVRLSDGSIAYADGSNDIVAHLTAAMKMAEKRPIEDDKVKRQVYRMLEALVPDNIEEFAKMRIPYLAHLVGRYLGTAFELPHVYRLTHGDNPVTELAVALYKLGIVMPPDYLDALKRAQARTTMHVLEAVELGLLKPEVLEEMGEDEDPYVTVEKPLWQRLKEVLDETYTLTITAYSLFYGLGVPVTRRLETRGSYYILNTVVPLRAAVKRTDALFLKAEVRSSKVSIETPRVGEVLFKPIDDAIKSYILLLTELRRRPRVTDPRAYQAVLYIFSDLDFFNGDPLKYYDNEDSVHTRLVKVYERALRLVSEAAELLAVHENDVYKLKYRGKITRGMAKIVLRINEINTELEELSAGIRELATLYNPRYIGLMSKRSENIYKALIERIDENLAAAPLPPQMLQRMMFLTGQAPPQQLVQQAQPPPAGGAAGAGPVAAPGPTTAVAAPPPLSRDAIDFVTREYQRLVTLANDLREFAQRTRWHPPTITGLPEFMERAGEGLPPGLRREEERGEEKPGEDRGREEERRRKEEERKRVEEERRREQREEERPRTREDTEEHEETGEEKPGQEEGREEEEPREPGEQPEPKPEEELTKPEQPPEKQPAEPEKTTPPEPAKIPEPERATAPEKTEEKPELGQPPSGESAEEETEVQKTTKEHRK